MSTSHPFSSPEFEHLGPWITGFEVEGRRFGGDYIAAEDPRALRFVEEFGRAPAPPAPHILECGCLEGGHTLLLTKAFPRGHITAVDVRENSLPKG